MNRTEADCLLTKILQDIRWAVVTAEVIETVPPGFVIDITYINGKHKRIKSQSEWAELTIMG